MRKEELDEQIKDKILELGDSVGSTKLKKNHEVDKLKKTMIDDVIKDNDKIIMNRINPNPVKKRIIPKTKERIVEREFTKQANKDSGKITEARFLIFNQRIDKHQREGIEFNEKRSPIFLRVQGAKSKEYLK